ncbi:hypothetical protein INS49_009036 [Diaporthe citri]|uniref:uncharacterized protein n=1 Tax=Diaporthe citri TaxID=83186 RepID=UPI001C80F9A9|nr:uncharacterized protein INS49_009036 [Diaporthe citri]KAG6363933.1 hypothetical protein INS49_009036 [Diaporthe citri]
MYNEPEITSLTCLSPDPHEDNIKDPILHFLGCVEISTRNEFLKAPSNVQSHEETAPEGTAPETTAHQPEGNQENRDIKDEDEKHLVQKIEDSRKAWEESDVYKDGIKEIRNQKIKKWRSSPEGSNEEDSEPEVSISKDNYYDPGRDVNTPFMLFKKQKEASSIYEPDNETKDPKSSIWGTFPNQKTNVQRLLFDKEKKNLLGGRNDSEKIRYFHIPSNNMLMRHEALLLTLWHKTSCCLKLLETYLMKDPPMHPRRTLDQAYYWSLNNTNHRDLDQVVYRATTVDPLKFHRWNVDRSIWTGHDSEDNKTAKQLENIEHEPCAECTANIQKVSRVIMVDQLWMWVLDRNTIITCFPKRYGANKHDTSGIHKSIRMRISEGGICVRSVFDLALVIFEECSNTFFDRTRTSDKQPQVLDEFSEAIGNIMHQQTDAFERLWRWTERASKMYRRLPGGGVLSELHIPLLDINPEGKLEKEIKDIVEELGIMTYIKKAEKDVLQSFVDNARQILNPGNAAEAQKRPETPSWFCNNAFELLKRVDQRIAQLEELERSAKSTAEMVKDLLELKQQQAGVVQAWQSVKYSNEAMRQGRSILVFTIVTIVFLPLSFMSSIFGMNAIEFGGSDNVMHLRDQFTYMFSISAGVIVLTLLFSISTSVRTLLWFVFTQSCTRLLVWTGLYRYVYLGMNFTTDGLYENAMKMTESLKSKEKEKFLTFRRTRREQKEKREQASADSHQDESNKKKMYADAIETWVTSRTLVMELVKFLAFLAAVLPVAYGAPTQAANSLHPEILAAMKRDLGLDAEQAHARVARDIAAAETIEQLKTVAGDSFAGAWTSEDGTLNVAVTDAALAADVTAAGATPAVVANSFGKLEEAKNALDNIDIEQPSTLAAGADSAASGIAAYYVDVAANKLVLEALADSTAHAESLASQVGLVAGDTATTSSSGGSLGTFSGSVFPGSADMSYIRTVSGTTLTGTIDGYGSGNLPVSGSTASSTGASICRSGSTTGVHCGTVRALGATVNYSEGRVTGLTQTNVCAEPGDSGGSFYTGAQAQGVTSGGSGDCSSGGTTYFQPVNEILSTYGLTLVKA